MMDILATIEENPEAWEATNRFESQVYQKDGDRVLLLPGSATVQDAYSLVRHYYPDVVIITASEMRAAWKVAGRYWRGRQKTWKRSQFQCSTDATELTHISGEYSGEFGMLRHVYYQCPTCQREYVDACEQLSSGTMSTWQTRLPNESWQDCDQPAPLTKQNPYGFTEQLLEAYS